MRRESIDQLKTSRVLLPSDAIDVRLELYRLSWESRSSTSNTDDQFISRSSRYLPTGGAYRAFVRVGEVRPMITVHYAVHAAHVHQLAAAVYTPVTHTRERAREICPRWAHPRASYISYVNTHTVTFVSFDISSLWLSIGANDVKIRIRASLRDIVPGSDGHSRPRGTIFLEKTCDRNVP